MFCKAITSRGTPCIASCKADSIYCHHHDKNLDECPVCLDEVPHIHTLQCGHRICVECFQMLKTDECPLCRRTCDRSYVHGGLIELRELLADLFFMDPTFRKDGANWWRDRYDSPEYLDAVKRVIDLSCRLHSVVFRQPIFLANIFQRCGIPNTDGLACVGRFKRCVESFRHRTGIPRASACSKGLPELLNDVVYPSARWCAHVEALWVRYREWEERERTETVHPLFRNHQ